MRGKRVAKEGKEEEIKEDEWERRTRAHKVISVVRKEITEECQG